MKKLRTIGLLATLGASMASAATAHDISLFGSSAPEAAAAKPRDPLGFDRPMSSDGRDGASGFYSGRSYSGRSVSKPNRNVIGQGVGGD